MSDTATAAAVRPYSFSAAGSPLAVRLSGQAATFRPLLMGSAGEPVFMSAGGGAGAGGPVADMVGLLRTAFGGEFAGQPGPAAADAPDEPGLGSQSLQLATGLASFSDLERERDESFAAGIAEGRRAAEESFGIKLLQFDRLLAGLAEARAAEPAELEPILADAALRLMADTLGADPALARSSLEPRAAAAAAHLSEQAGAARLKLHPVDFVALSGHATWPANVTPEPDPAIPPGGFKLLAGDSLIEDLVVDRFARAAESLQNQ